MMFKRWIGFASVAAAVLGGGYLVSAGLNHTSVSAKAEASTKPPIAVNSVASKDKDRARHDLLGSTPLATPDGSKWEVEFYVGYDFERAEGRYRTFFFETRHMAADGSWDRCGACGAGLAAVTYRANGESWDVATRDLAIAEIGGNGRLPPAEEILGSVLRSEQALIFVERDTDRGYSVVNAHFIAYRDGWKSLGRVMTSDGNTSASECLQHRRCYFWQGEIKTLSSESNGFPDLLVERNGTQLHPVSGLLEPANAVHYQFAGDNYQRVLDKPIATSTMSATPPAAVAAGSGSAAAS